MKREFYKLLYQKDEFCCVLGKVMLSASKLETLLRKYLRIVGEDVPEKSATLGNLIKHLRKNDLLTNNGEIHFGQINLQRNYLIHNLFGSFIDEIEQALLPVENLVPMDVEIYAEKASETAENFELYSELVSKAIKKLEERNLENDSKIKPLL